MTMRTFTEAWNENKVNIQLTHEEALLLYLYLERSVLVTEGKTWEGQCMNIIEAEALAGNERAIMANRARLKVMNIIAEARKRRG